MESVPLNWEVVKPKVLDPNFSYLSEGQEFGIQGLKN